MHWSSEAHLEELKRLGCLILHDINVHKMGSDPILMRMKFDGNIFNFPHAGHFPDICERHKTYQIINPYIQQTSLILAFEMFSLLEMIFFDFFGGVNRMHKELLSYFFKNAKGLLNEDGEVHVAHREDYPYDHWKVTKLAKKEGFHLFEKVEFQKSNYPDYHNKRGGDIMSNQTFLLGNIFMFNFTLHVGDEEPCQSSSDEGDLCKILSVFHECFFNNLKRCRKHVSVLPQGLSQLKALQTLKVENCDSLTYIPDELQHLTSLHRLGINACRILEPRWEKEVGEDWCIISQIPNIYIDGKEIQ
ncbi:hypothetical protein GIB67_038157 [Kingdonia uniflora]|uniref:25S rRNA (uridine-N(3))-methyltransferase BMT5-like domain-containing protein n=1 Tax=Kingdonia uniflora TaxID=39325 RepID=A0A7J7M5P6_9MAGN|nr:hypothetical protein GIB67_038157 [Kingdonia uniflora]